MKLLLAAAMLLALLTFGRYYYMSISGVDCHKKKPVLEPKAPETPETDFDLKH